MQFIGCDAHKKFSMFVAVNEKGYAGEVMRVLHDHELYREFLARLPTHCIIRSGRQWQLQVVAALHECNCARALGAGAL